MLLVIQTSVRATALCDEVRLALADAKTLPVAEAHYWRYLSLYNVADEKERVLHEKVVMLFHLNSLSQEPEFGRPIKVGPTLYRVNLLWYGPTFAKAYENLHKSNPYFPCFERVQIQAVVPQKAVKETPLERFNRLLDGKVPAEVVDPKDVKVTSFLPAKELAELANRLQTRIPLARADWVFYRSAISLNRAGDGYYDFHGLKSRDDAYKLAGLDLKQVARLKADMAAQIAESDVAVNRLRQVWWVKSYAGDWFQTFDVNQDGKGKRNLLRLAGTALDKVEFQHDAEETFFTLPNGLWGVIANDDRGALQATVPDSIASDDTTTSKDKRIHTSLSCFRCHEEGLRPINDWGREVYRQAENANKNGQVLLGSPDPDKLYRLKQLYLRDMPEQVELANRSYATRLKRLCGLTPKEVANGVGAVWKRHADSRLGMKELAAELGVKPEVWDRALRKHAADRYARKELVDPLLAGLIAERPKTLGRPQVEELFPVMQAILGEYKP